MTDIWTLGLTGMRRMLDSGEATPIDLVEACLQRITALDADLKAFVHVDSDRALAAAGDAAKALAAGQGGPLCGLPLALKDICDVADMPTGNGSHLTEGAMAPGNSVVAQRLAEAGAVIIGKTETHEFAIGGPDTALPHGPARNPWNLAHYPGGSSSGSGSAVAAGLVPGAIGTDTGGSIRIPAAFCGLAGLKPTYGRVSRRGVSPLAFSLDHIGPMTWTVEDNALMLAAMAGHDPADPASADRPVDDYAAAIGRSVKGLRVGLIDAFHGDPVFDPEGIAAFDAAASVLRAAGATVAPVAASALQDYVACNRVILLSEAYAVHEADLAARPDRYGPYLRARILPGALLSAADYVQALRRRRELCAEMAGILDRVDVLLVIGAVGPAPRIEAVRPEALLTGPPSVTSPFNVTGLPALSVCAGFTTAGLPLSVQVVGRPFDEATVYSVGHVIEAELGERDRRPDIALGTAVAA